MRVRGEHMTEEQVQGFERARRAVTGQQVAGPSQKYEGAGPEREFMPGSAADLGRNCRTTKKRKNPVVGGSVVY